MLTIRREEGAFKGVDRYQLAHPHDEGTGFIKEQPALYQKRLEIKQSTLIDVYFVYPKLSLWKRLGAYKRLFQSGIAINPTENPLFIEKELAFHYCSYMHSQSVILKASVSPKLVQSKNQILCLESHYLNSDQIQGCYTINAGEVSYYANEMVPDPTQVS